MEDIILEGLTVFSFPGKHRRRLLTTNGLERLNREIRRSTRASFLFPYEVNPIVWIHGLIGYHVQTESSR
jgi:transposase-like protein